MLEGSVSRANDALQIDARFTRVSGNAVIWNKRFERDVKALPAILDEISLAIVNELRVALGRGQRRYDLDPDLYYQFLLARSLHAKRGPENSRKAANLFQEVVSRAPGYAPAWAGLASALAQVSRPSTGEEIIPPDPALGPAALKALQLDPLLAEAHAALANKYAGDREWVNARMSFLKALALNPTLTETHNDFVLGVLMPTGDTREALRQLAAARIVDPLSLDVRRTEAHVFVEAGRYEDAIENCRWIKAARSGVSVRRCLAWPGSLLFRKIRRGTRGARARRTPVLGIRGVPSRRERPPRRSRSSGREESRLAVANDAHLRRAGRQGSRIRRVGAHGRDQLVARGDLAAPAGDGASP